MKKDRNLNRDRLDFANDNIGPMFRSLFLPTLVGMIFNSALTVIDGIFVGRGVGTEGIAAVNIVAPVFMVITGIGLMFGIGASVIASIRLSENKVKAARIIMTQAFIVGLLIVGVIGLGSFVCPRGVVHALGCSPLLEENAVSYLLWLLPGLFFLFVECVGMMLIRLDGAPKYAMTIQIVAAVVNIVLDWIFIFPLGLGVKGAAMATSISCIFGGSMAVLYFFRFSEVLNFARLKLSIAGICDAARQTWEIVKIGFATLLTELAMSVMLFTANHVFIRALGDNGVAAFSIACYLFPFLFSVNNSVSEAIQPIISFNFGAGNMKRVETALHTALIAAAICGIIEVASIAGGAEYLVMMFLDPGTEAFELACSGLPKFAMCGIFFALNIAFIGYYQAINKALTATVFTLLRGMIFVVPCLLWLPDLIGIPGLWLAIPVSELLTLIVIFFQKYIRPADKRITIPL